MEVKSGIKSDECRECGRTIYHGQGCRTDFKCADCCRLAGHQHEPEAPAARKSAEEEASDREWALQIGAAMSDPRRRS